MTAKEGENRFDKGELLRYNFFIIFPLQPPQILDQKSEDCAADLEIRL